MAAAITALKMTWQHQRRRLPLGLKNLGNTCYLNSVLQCLTYTPPLAQFCLSNLHSSLCKSLKDCPFCILERQIARSLTLEGSLVDSPSKIQKCINLYAENFRWGRQEDAHEFLRYVIDACHNSCIKGVKKRESSLGGKKTVMKEIFGGALLSQVKCLSCKGESDKMDEIMDISLDIFRTNSVKDALGRFFQPEVLDGNNKYNCSKCKKLSVAKKQMFVLRAPNVLVIQLKRFEGIHGGKINKNIEFEEGLVLSKFMCSTTQDLQPEYSLFGSIVHSGFSPESGHYYAYIKDPFGHWYCCNDAHVSLSNTQEVLSEKVYILFYLQSSQSPRSSKTVLACNCTTTDSGSRESLQQKPAELSEQSIVRPNGLPSSKNNVSTILKNGKISTNLHIKSFNFKNPEMKKVIANGNGNSEIHINGSAEKNGNCKLSPDVKKNKIPPCNGSMEKLKVENKANLSSQCRINSVNGTSSDVVENGKKQMLHVPNGNGLKVDVDEKPSQNLATVNKELDYDHSSNSMLSKNGSIKVASKRKPCDTDDHKGLDTCTEGSGSFSRNDASCKIQTPCPRSRSQELESFKELLASEASSFLRSCGWVDKVHNFMRTRKRICIQPTGSCPDNTEARKQLKLDAQKPFMCQIPESLKEHLIERLRFFSQGKRLLD